jgi:hypothetical protein
MQKHHMGAAKMIPVARFAIVLTGCLTLFACASNPFVSTWKAPDAQPLQLRGSKVAAVVMMKNEASRRAAEDALAREITARGAQGVPMYTILPEGKPENEAAARAALEQAGMAGAVVMRPVGVEKEVSSTPVTYSAPMYAGYYGGYYGHGWGATWGPSTMQGGEIRTDTIVVVETLIYSLRQNKLVWGGQSRSTNPKNVDQLVQKLAAAVAQELEKQGLISAPTS